MPVLVLIVGLLMALVPTGGLSAQRAVPAQVLPGTADASFGTVRGTALDEVARVLPGARIRARDARTGRLVGDTVTDDAGLFEFPRVDPGSYVVELMGSSRAVLATTRVFAIDAGEVISVVVKLPYRVQPLAGFLGHTAAQAATILSVAAGLGVLAVEVTGEEISPN